MEKRRITPAEIAVGQTLSWDVYDADGHLLLRRGQTVASDSQIEKLIERGLYAEAEPLYERRDNEHPIDVQRASALALILEARRRLQYLSAPNRAKENFPEGVAGVRELIREACRLNRNVALAAIVLDRNGRYSIRHAVDAATLCQLAGTALGMAEAELAATVAAALTMNISMLLIQDGLQAQKQPLGAERRQAIQRHPQESVDMLRQYGVGDTIWLAIVMNHHEALDGSGYPARRKAGDIPLPAVLVTLADQYCAGVSARDYRAPLLPNAALRKAILGHGGQLDKALAGPIIRTLGLYPPGTVVRLANGDVGVVTHPGEKANTPRVCALIGASGAALGVPIKRDTANGKYAVQEMVNWAKLGPAVNMQAVWGKDAAVR